MGNSRPLPLKCWEAFLTFHGFSYQRTKGSHDQWVKKGKRTLPVWGNKKEIPFTHLQTGCFTIGCTIPELYKWASDNC